MSIIGIVIWLGECGVPPLEGVVTNTHSPSCGQWCQDPRHGHRTGGMGGAGALANIKAHADRDWWPGGNPSRC